MYSRAVRSLSHQRCFNHASREAVARCPECGRFFCRECVTEHQDRVVCASCLKTLAKVPFTRRGGWVGAGRVPPFAGGALLAWMFFYWVGQTLLQLPSSFHDGTLWQGTWLTNP